MPSLRAIAAPWSGPAPPNASSAKWRGSCPRSMLTIRMALAMFSLAISTIEWARSSTRHVQRVGELLASPHCHHRHVEAHLAAEEVVGVETSEDEVGVGQRDLVAAGAVADRAGVGAGAARPDLEEAAGVDPGDRTASGADSVDVDERNRRRDAPLDLVRRRVADGGAEDDADVGARASDIERDHVVDLQRSATYFEATAPPAGPDIARWIGWSAAALASISPPLDFIIAQLRSSPASSGRLADWRRTAASTA